MEASINGTNSLTPDVAIRMLQEEQAASSRMPVTKTIITGDILQNYNPSPIIIVVICIAVVICIWLIYIIFLVPSIDGKWYDMDFPDKVFIVNSSIFTDKIRFTSLSTKKVYTGKIQHNMITIPEMIDDKLVWDYNNKIICYSNSKTEKIKLVLVRHTTKL